MNIMNKCMLAVAALAFAACTHDYDEINSNPYEPGSLAADDYALGSAMNNLAGCVISPDVNTTQFTECLTGSPYSGYYADSNDGFNDRALSRYIPRDDWAKVFLKSDRFIPTIYSNLTMIKNAAAASGDYTAVNVAQLIKVAAMDRVTDAYGPIPYTQIGEDGKITIPYDSEKTIYYKFFEEIQEAREYLLSHPGAALTASADYIYGGDISKWIKFANSLQLRLAMRISFVDAAKAKEMAEDAVDPANGGVIETNAENAAWNYFGATQNPLYVATRYNQAAGCVTGGDTHAAADIIMYMNGYNDPRRAAYFVESEWEDASGNPIPYVGLRHGIVIPANNITRKYCGVNVTPSDPLNWLCASEVAFLRAEGAAVHGWDMGGSAQDFYENGIRLSFEQYGVEGADAYLAQTGLPAGVTYVDPADLNTYSDNIALVGIAWDDAASVDEKLERIIVQKWIANWQNGNESWADIRRTGFPVLIPASDDGNASGGIVDSQKGARRLPYPLDEYVSNADNVTYAVQNYLTRGADNMGTDIWWAGRR